MSIAFPVRRLGLGVAVLAGVLVAGGARPATAADPHGGGARDQLIVVLRDGIDADSTARAHAARFGVTVEGVYHHALDGYVAQVPRSARAALVRDRRVAYVENDQEVSVQAQSLPTGIDRIEAELNATSAIGGEGPNLQVDIAVIDTGITSHPDLIIAGGTRCTSLLLGLFPRCGAGSFADGNGHGTHVAGIVAAGDNGFGGVGVAPGARLWAVKALDDKGSGAVSQIVAALDWVTARASVIEVANMSLGFEGTSQALDDAINRATGAGVVVVVAAGNAGRDARTFSPANHFRVITASALADFDGQPGGGAEPTCRTDQDDSLADFSNFGDDVDIAAPGVCITSTWNNGGYATISGTSMASPHVAGAAAAYIVARGIPRTADRWSAVREGLRTEWAVDQSSPCGFTGGRSEEPLLLLGPCSASGPAPH